MNCFNRLFPFTTRPRLFAPFVLSAVKLRVNWGKTH
jgi:hypothetical protein